jgi:hypothetical protein
MEVHKDNPSKEPDQVKLADDNLPKVTLQQVEDAKKGGVEHTVVTSAMHADNV